MHDLAVRGGRVVTPDGLQLLDIAISDGTIVEMAPEVTGARDEIDAGGQVVMPAIVDVHVHFNEPGRTQWEGATTGSHALAAGGGTVFFDMPLNSTPCTIGPAEFDGKLAALEAASIADFGLWGGLVPGRIGDMAALADRGVVGFKAFMCDSGLPEFPRADDVTLFEGMKEAARLGLPVAVHAESEELTRELGKAMSGDDVAAFLGSRPLVAEIDAIQRALLFAGETRAALHIVHVSSGRGVALAFAAKAAGVDVSIETCPHYLFFTNADLERLGTVAKCAPPLRADVDRQALWTELLAGHIDIVASDHSPCTPALKSGPFRRAWGGIAGIQSTLDVMIESGCHQRQLSFERVADLLATRPAARFRIPAKGAIAVGNDADLALIEMDEPHMLEAERLRQRYPASPYVGRQFRCRVRRTVRRGDTLALDGRIVARSTGQFVRPSNRGESDV